MKDKTDLRQTSEPFVDINARDRTKKIHLHKQQKCIFVVEYDVNVIANEWRMNADSRNLPVSTSPECF